MKETGLHELSEKLIGSEIKAELLRLFHMNPGILDTVEGIARRVGRLPKDVEAEISPLVEVGVLRRERFGKLDIVSLNTGKDKEIRDRLAALVKGDMEG